MQCSRDVPQDITQLVVSTPSHVDSYDFYDNSREQHEIICIAAPARLPQLGGKRIFLSLCPLREGARGRSRSNRFVVVSSRWQSLAVVCSRLQSLPVVCSRLQSFAVVCSCWQLLAVGLQLFAVVLQSFAAVCSCLQSFAVVCSCWQLLEVVSSC